MRKTLAFLSMSVALSTAISSVFAQDTSSTAPVKPATKEGIGGKMKNGASTVGKDTENGVKAVGRGTETVFKDTGKGLKKIGTGTKNFVTKPFHHKTKTTTTTTTTTP